LRYRKREIKRHLIELVTHVLHNYLSRRKSSYYAPIKVYQYISKNNYILEKKGMGFGGDAPVGESPYFPDGNCIPLCHG